MTGGISDIKKGHLHDAASSVANRGETASNSASAESDPAGTTGTVFEQQSVGSADPASLPDSMGEAISSTVADEITLTGPIGGAISLLEGLQITTGLPWWTVIPMTAVGT